MKKTGTILFVIVLMTNVNSTKAQKFSPYNWAGQFTFSGTHLSEGKVGYFLDVEGEYKHVKPDICICTKTEKFSVSVIGGIGIPIGESHLELGGGAEFGDTIIPIANLALESRYFDLAVVTKFTKEAMYYQFSGIYFVTKNVGLGAGWDTNFSIPILKMTMRLPLTWKNNYSSCSYDY